MKSEMYTAKSLKLRTDKSKKANTTNKTREAILDKAEELFANHGMGAFSLRKIAAAAQVEPTLITYHVGNKDALIEAVVERRMSVLNDVRIKSLGETLQRTKNNPSVEDLLRAIYGPWLEMSQSEEPGWQNFCKLICRITIMPWLGDILEKHMNKIETHLTNAFRLALPHLSDDELFWGLVLVHGGAILLFSDSPRLEQVASHCSTSEQSVEKGYEIFIQNACRAFRPPP